MTASSEARSRKVVLPAVAGLHLRDAEIVLQNAGLTSTRVLYVEAYDDEFSVVEQEPRDGQLVDRDRVITLRVARKNLVRYLPQVYQQSATDRDSFLRGFLSVTQQISDRGGRRLDRIHELFDPRTTDAEFLPWLASWLALVVSPDWSELQARKMLLAAARLFPHRGTARAIAEFVRIYTGADVRIEENVWPFAGFRIGPNSTIGLDSVILPPVNLAHVFVVRLDRTASAVSEPEIIKIHRIIQDQKPAHTSYFLAFRDESDAGQMGVFMSVGVDSIGAAEPMGIGIGVGVVEAQPQAAPEPAEPDKPAKAGSSPEPAPEPDADESEADDAAAPAPKKKPARKPARGKKSDKDT
ncbi:MAG: PASTA domain-containing protein [Deltaproteobacteria bacterium]|nr:PASTA domain-containing protein [Deltaproteobacteria bacterium]MCB9785935.1 PASTA domain-containing protein [Deltaproteobacteria bacterium]